LTILLKYGIFIIVRKYYILEVDAMAKTKIWYEIYGDGPTENNILLAKVKSKGNAYIVAQALKAIYKNIKIK